MQSKEKKNIVSLVSYKQTIPSCRPGLNLAYKKIGLNLPYKKIISYLLIFTFTITNVTYGYERGDNLRTVREIETQSIHAEVETALTGIRAICVDGNEWLEGLLAASGALAIILSSKRLLTTRSIAENEPVLQTIINNEEFVTLNNAISKLLKKRAHSTEPQSRFEHKKFNLDKAIAYILECFKKDPNRKTLPLQIEIARALGVSQSTVSDHFEEILTRLEEEGDKRVKRAVKLYRLKPKPEKGKKHKKFDIDGAIRYILALFKEEPERKTLPLQIEIARALGVSQSTVSNYFEEVLTRLERIDDKRIKEAVRLYRLKSKKFNLDEVIAYILECFKKDPNRKTLPLQIEIARALGVSQSAVSDHFEEVLTRLERIDNDRVREAVRLYRLKPKPEKRKRHLKEKTPPSPIDERGFAKLPAALWFGIAVGFGVLIGLCWAFTPAIAAVLSAYRPEIAAFLGTASFVFFAMMAKHLLANGLKWRRGAMGPGQRRTRFKAACLSFVFSQVGISEIHARGLLRKLFSGAYSEREKLAFAEEFRRRYDQDGRLSKNIKATLDQIEVEFKEAGLNEDDEVFSYIGPMLEDSLNLLAEVLIKHKLSHLFLSSSVTIGGFSRKMLPALEAVHRKAELEKKIKVLIEKMNAIDDILKGVRSNRQTDINLIYIKGIFGDLNENINDAISAFDEFKSGVEVVRSKDDKDPLNRKIEIIDEELKHLRTSIIRLLDEFPSLEDLYDIAGFLIQLVEEHDRLRYEYPHVIWVGNMKPLSGTTQTVACGEKIQASADIFIPERFASEVETEDERKEFAKDQVDAYIQLSREVSPDVWQHKWMPIEYKCISEHNIHDWHFGVEFELEEPGRYKVTALVRARRKGQPKTEEIPVGEWVKLTKDPRNWGYHYARNLYGDAIVEVRQGTTSSQVKEAEFEGPVFVNTRHLCGLGGDKQAYHEERAWELAAEIKREGLSGQEEFKDGQLRVVLTGGGLEISLAGEFNTKCEEIKADENKSAEILISFDTVQWLSKNQPRPTQDDIDRAIKSCFTLKRGDAYNSGPYIRILHEMNLNYRIYYPDGRIGCEEILNDSGVFQVMIRLFRTKKELIGYVKKDRQRRGIVPIIIAFGTLAGLFAKALPADAEEIRDGMIRTATHAAEGAPVYGGELAKGDTIIAATIIFVLFGIFVWACSASKSVLYPGPKEYPDEPPAGDATAPEDAEDDEDKPNKRATHSKEVQEIIDKYVEEFEGRRADTRKRMSRKRPRKPKGEKGKREKVRKERQRRALTKWGISPGDARKRKSGGKRGDGATNFLGGFASVGIGIGAASLHPLVRLVLYLVFCYFYTRANFKDKIIEWLHTKGYWRAERIAKVFFVDFSQSRITSRIIEYLTRHLAYAPGLTIDKRRPDGKLPKLPDAAEASASAIATLDDFNPLADNFILDNGTRCRILPLTEEHAKEKGHEILGLINKTYTNKWNMEKLLEECPGKWENSFAIADENGKIIAVLLAYEHEPNGTLAIRDNHIFILRICTDEEFRRKYIAVRLLGYLGAHFASRGLRYLQPVPGHEYIVLQTNAENIPANTLYRGLGFANVQRIQVGDYLYNIYRIEAKKLTVNAQIKISGISRSDQTYIIPDEDVTAVLHVSGCIGNDVLIKKIEADVASGNIDDLAAYAKDVAKERPDQVELIRKRLGEISAQLLAEFDRRMAGLPAAPTPSKPAAAPEADEGEEETPPAGRSTKWPGAVPTIEEIIIPPSDTQPYERLTLIGIILSERGPQRSLSVVDIGTRTGEAMAEFEDQLLKSGYTPDICGVESEPEFAQEGRLMGRNIFGFEIPKQDKLRDKKGRVDVVTMHAPDAANYDVFIKYGIGLLKREGLLIIQPAASESTRAEDLIRGALLSIDEKSGFRVFRIDKGKCLGLFRGGTLKSGEVYIIKRADSPFKIVDIIKDPADFGQVFDVKKERKPSAKLPAAAPLAPSSGKECAITDTKFSIELLVDLFHRELPNGTRRYEVYYDLARLSDGQIKVIEKYMEVLGNVTRDEEHLKPRPFRSKPRSKRRKGPIISVICKRDEITTEAKIVVPEDRNPYYLRIVATLNRALIEASQLSGLSEEKERTIIIKDLPMLEEAQVDDYNKTAKELLTAA